MPCHLGSAIWRFCNGAQIIIDQYLTTSEQKWDSYLQPHPHACRTATKDRAQSIALAASSDFCSCARMTICALSTARHPRSYSTFCAGKSTLCKKKPLILFSPKVLLRHPLCTSALNDFATGSFQEILDDPEASQAKRLLFCTGKIYYELLQERREKQERRYRNH